jgi:hypothetical protein
VRSNPETRLPEDSLLVQVVRGHAPYEGPDDERRDRGSGGFTSNDPVIK